MPRCRWRRFIRHVGCNSNLHIVVLCRAYAIDGKKIIVSVKYYFHHFTLNRFNDFVTTMQLSHNKYYNSRIVYSQTHNSVLFERVIILQMHVKELVYCCLLSVHGTTHCLVMGLALVKPLSSAFTWLQL